jgi:enoyl-CoA hydratase/carnithine racemase
MESESETVKDSRSKKKEHIYTGIMITAEEAERFGLVNRVISSSTREDDNNKSLPVERTPVPRSTQSSMSSQEEQEQQQRQQQQQPEKQRANKLAKF